MTCFYFIYLDCFTSFGHIPTTSTKNRNAIMLSAIHSIILQDLIIPPKGTQMLLDAAASQDKAVKWYNDGWHDLLFGRHSKRLTTLAMRMKECLPNMGLIFQIFCRTGVSANLC